MAHDASFKIKGGKVGILLLHRLCGTPVEMRFVATAQRNLELAGRESFLRLARCIGCADIGCSSW